MSKWSWPVVVAVSVVLWGCVIVQQVPREAASGAGAGSAGANSPSPATQSARWQPQTISDAIALCKAVQQQDNIPVSCAVTYVRGEPWMTIVFPNLSAYEGYAQPMLAAVAVPFCRYANQANRAAFLLFAVGPQPAQQLFSVYSCETGNATRWLPLRDLLPADTY